MTENESNFNIWELIGFIKISPARYNCIKTIANGYKMPTEIVKKT